jgi:hypothetical protein
MSVQPFLQIGFGPSLIQPVTGVRRCLSGLLCDGFVIGANLLQQGITLSGLRDYRIGKPRIIQG